MNQRIKQLAEQAELTKGVWAVPDFILEKFAELIVRECAYLNFRSTGFVTSEGESMVRDMIKQHFGVEE